ncbi:MAG: tRNA uridine-5-carboxymethylaminomethyl(34) synthesis GTPase MnmE [Candidatus Omnitrophica bacterium]|nr:tRNA uridine-5-carboxymethylaminomethyl(34) synthesis GTPase MnmE [Candidatus Omnitrophota bacterium]MCM8823922.1 tRNA uridine-5-carboxymethylaminomethyl(34) synthesis GTPase MnmE [Candidatus Omnitrophota bacterium]
MIDIKGYDLNDTIAAIATFPAKSALGVIKISGERALEIISKIFLPKRKKDIKKQKTYTLHYGWIIDKSKNNRIVDEVLVSVMKSPYTYTRQDVVEISSHGGLVVLNKILNLVISQGARLAKPGEFTYRAFINGRLDLLQTQAISDIVEAKSERMLFSLTKQLKGEFSRKIEKIKEEIKEIVSSLEANINFPEDTGEIDIKSLINPLNDAKKHLYDYLNVSKIGDVYKDGLSCVICGRTNVGKSTLFNCLLKEERVLVSNIRGTTRDTVEETINIEGVPIKICDTAGILEAKNSIEEKAMKKSYDKLDSADIILFMLDWSKPISKLDIMLWEKVKDNNVIIVVNKIDLKQRLDIKELKISNKPLVKISALKNIGIGKIENILKNNIYRKGIQPKEDLLFLAQWQKEILRTLCQRIEETIKLIKDGSSIDHILFSLKPALDDLCRLKGENIDEEILKKIFTNFCIGK